MLETVTNLVPLVDSRANVPTERTVGLELFNVQDRIQTSIHQLIPFITFVERLVELLETVTNLVSLVNPVNVMRASTAGLEF